MKSKWVAVFVVLLALTATAAVPAQEAGDVRMNLTVTWDLGIRIGVDYRISDRLGVQADLGSSLLVLEGAFMFTGDAFVAYDLLPADRPVRLRALAGVPDWRILFIDPVAAMIAFGGSLEAGYEFAGPWGAFLRLGAGVPFFAESGEFERRTTGYPLGIWPDISAGAKLTL